MNELCDMGCNGHSEIKTTDYGDICGNCFNSICKSIKNENEFKKVA